MVERFLDHCCLQQKSNVGGDVMKMGMLFLMSYTFLLRVPSEALPAQAHQGGQSGLSIENGRLVSALQQRLGSSLVLNVVSVVSPCVMNKTGVSGVD